MRKLVKAILSIAVVGGFLAGSSSAEAAFKVRASVDGGATWITATDNVTGGGAGTADDLNPNAGRIVSFYDLGNVSFTVVGGTSKPVIGNPYVSVLDLNLSGNFEGAASVIIEITDTGFAPPNYPAGLGYLGASLGGNAELNQSLTGVSYTSYLQGTDGQGNDNQEFGGSPNGPPPADITAGPDTTYGGFVLVEGVALSPYSLTGRLTFSGVNGDAFSFDNVTNFSVPLPGGVLLALTGVPALGLGAWLRRRKPAAV